MSYTHYSQIQMKEMDFTLRNIILLFTLYLNVDAEECLDSVKRLGGYQATFHGRCYMFVTTEETWVTANRKCQSWGGNLVSIPNKATMDFIRNRLTNHLGWSKNGVWIGAHARYGGPWRWTTGEKMKYRYWASGQPSTTGGISFEDCGLMRRSDGWRWHDYHCNFFLYQYRYICQFGVKPTTTSSTTTTTTTKAPTTTKATTKAPTTTKATTKAPTTTKATTPTTVWSSTTALPETSTTMSSVIAVVVANKNSKSERYKGKGYNLLSGTMEGSKVEGSLASTDNASQSTKDTGIVVGFVVGGIILVVIFILATILLRRRRRKPLYDANVRFSNLSYMHVNRQSPDHAAANVYVDANEMNKLYEEVNKLTNHGVNDNEVGGATGGERGAVGEPIYDVPDDIGNCKTENAKLNNALGEKNVGVSLTKLAPKKLNIEVEEEKRVVDPSKPSNLQCQQDMYVNAVTDNDPTLEDDGGYEEPVSATTALSPPTEETDIKQGTEQEHLYDEVN